MVEWLAGNRIRGTSAEKPTLGVSGVGGWKELARTTLDSAADTITVSSLPDKRYYTVLTNIIGSGSTWCDARLNSDTGSNYALRKSLNGASDTTSINQSSFLIPPNTFTSSYFMTAYISNLASKEKLGIENCVDGSTAGAGTAPERYEGVAKWTNTADSISSFSRRNDYTGSFDTGSEIVVLGWDPADTHTSNFWEELASVDLSGGSADIIDSGTISAKKYLWVQAFLDGTGEIDTNFQFNSDTGSNYSNRRVANGGTDATVINQSNIHLSATLGSGSKCFQNAFIVNNSANEKLVIAHNCTADTAGAGTAPIRDEVVGKWANTSNSITSVQINNVKAGSYDTGTIMKVWGSN